MYKNRKIVALFFFVVISVCCRGQNDSVSSKEKWRLDSNYVVSYPDKLVIGLFQSWRYYDLLFVQTLTPDTSGQSAFNYIARGNNSTGISFAYDKISFALSSSVEATETDIARKGVSDTKNLSFSINSKKYRLEAAYRKYTGFYDNYTSRRDTNFITDTSAFYQLPGMYSKAFRLKGFYFFNKKKRFSYGAAFNNTARQLKTAGSFLLISNLYKFTVNSDTTFIPTGASSYYPQWENWNHFKTLGLSVNLGYSFNLIMFKRLFANITGTLGLELQQRTYSTNDRISSKSDMNFGWSAGDLRGSLGYNGEKFYVMLSYIGDFSVYKLNKFQIDTRLHSGVFTFGYRFNKKEGKAIRWLKNNKIYRML
jgi:hypothetical protein